MPRQEAKAAQARKSERFDPLTIRLAVAVTALVGVTLFVVLFLAAQRHYDSRVDGLRRQVATQGRLMQSAFEHEMLAGQRDAIWPLVEKFAQTPGVLRLMIFDSQGELRFASDKKLFERKWDRNTSAECSICHTKPPGQRAESALVDIAGGEVLRNVLPFRNQESCHECHGTSHVLNGVLITDTSLEEASTELRAEVLAMQLWIVGLTLVLIIGFGLISRRVYVGPLRALEARARAIAAGDLRRRVSVGRDGPFARLGEAFNHMAGSLQVLLDAQVLQRARLENLMNSVDDGLLVVDVGLNVVALNDSFARRAGSSAEELRLHTCCEIFGQRRSCGEGFHSGGCPAKRVFETGALQTAIHTWRDPATHTERSEEVFASPIVDGDAQVMQVVLVARDITARKDREARMATAERLASLGMLASGFSHELNTPLNTVLVCADEISRASQRGDAGRSALAEIRESADLIQSEIERCRRITRQFLSLSAGRALSPSVLDVRKVIEAVVPLIQATARGAGVALRVEDIAPGLSIQADGGAVQQVLLNLIVNAVQACTTGESVTVAARATGDGGVAIVVSDTGHGIPPEATERLFEPFFSRKEGGTGLGLFISANLARQWHGEITVASEPGRGSTFVALFPPMEGA